MGLQRSPDQVCRERKGPGKIGEPLVSVDPGRLRLTWSGSGDQRRHDGPWRNGAASETMEWEPAAVGTVSRQAEFIPWGEEPPLERGVKRR